MLFFLRNARINGQMLDRIRISLRSGNLSEARKEALRSRSVINEAIVAQIDAATMSRSERESLVLYYHQRLQSLLLSPH